MAKTILHIDLNAFFVTAEELKDPSLVGKPVAIGHLGRAGIVSTCSYKAREYGVHSGMPTYIAVQKCRDLILLGGDHRFYKKLSRDFYYYLTTISPLVEMASVDEAYVDITKNVENETDVIQFLNNIQMNLYKNTGLKSSLGVSTTKFLAKIASEIKKPMGITIIRNRDIQKVIFPLQIESLFGIGKKTAPRLRELGIKTIGDFYYQVLVSNAPLANEVGNMREYFYQALHGRTSDEIILEYQDPKSISSAHTLTHDTNDEEELFEVLSDLCQDVYSSMKKEHKNAKTIQITYKFPDFRSTTKHLTLKNPLTSYEDYLSKIKELYYQSYNHQPIRLIGVGVSNLFNPKDDIVQLTFENYEFYEKESQTHLLMKKINNKYEKPLLIKASDLRKNDKK